MKPSIYRRIRRRTASQEVATAKKDHKQEQSFFGEAAHETFFQPSPVVQRKCEKCEEEEKVQRQPEKKEEEIKLMRVEDKKEEDKKLQKKEEEKKEEEKVQKKDAGVSSTSTSAGINSYVSSINGKGNPLPANANQFFSSRMGYNFSKVKVHTDKDAADSAKEVNAKAYTIGNHIVFSEGQFNNESDEGKKLMAHELTHVMQNDEANAQNIKRTEEDTAPQQEEEILPNVNFTGEGTLTDNPTHYANCNGVRVRGSTTANYTSSFSSDGNQVRARSCRGCSASECITSTGTVTSDFSANPSVSLPSAPSGLSECETTAVQNFIDTTLSAHEQQHVDAFNTYIGTVTTPYTFTGCVTGLEPHIRAVHRRIDTTRRAASNALSAALDANGANIFNVTCNCPDPVPDAGAKK